MDNIQEEIEDKIIDDINSGVGGRLVIFKPEKKGMEDYLAVERRGEYKEKEIYFKINSLIVPAKKEDFIKDFYQESLKADKNFYLIFACFDEAMQKISDYIWLIPFSQFKDIADIVKSPDNQKLLRFMAPLDVKKQSKYSKFLVNTKNLGKMILDAFENNGRFDFKGRDFQERKINLESLKEFLCEARENTYAANASSIDNPRLLASKQLEFSRGDYYYRDIFFDGEKNFIGQEIVYQDAKPVWGMNYKGNSIGELETRFLKESLLKLSEKCRLGGEPSGSCEYEKREFKYQDKGQGNFEDFSGTEEIFLKEKSIYKLNYQGGLI